MSNLRQQIAASESVRSKFLSGKPFTEEEVRMELAPSTDLRKQLDEAMQLILALTAACQKMREERDHARMTLTLWSQNLIPVRRIQL